MLLVRVIVSYEGVPHAIHNANLFSNWERSWNADLLEAVKKMAVEGDYKVLKDMVEALEDKGSAASMAEMMQWIGASTDKVAQKIGHIEFRSSAVVDQPRHMDRQRRQNAVMHEAAGIEHQVLLKNLVGLMQFWWESKLFQDEKLVAKMNQMQIKFDEVREYIKELMIIAAVGSALEKNVLNAEKTMDIEKQNVHLVVPGHENEALWIFSVTYPQWLL